MEYDKTFHCPDCEEIFTEARNLERHLKIHRNEFHHCQYCTYRSTQIDNLKSHIDRKHYDDKPLQQSMEIKQQPPPAKCQPVKQEPVVFQSKIDSDTQFVKRLQLPNNFVYAGATQSVCLHYDVTLVNINAIFLGKNNTFAENP